MNDLVSRGNVTDLQTFFLFFLEDHNLPFSTLVCFRQDCGNRLESQLDGIVSDGKTGE